MSKEAESRVRDLSNHYGWHRHKYGDVRYCIHCHSPLPKTENAPDFYIGQVGDWIEAKNSDSSGTWDCSELAEGGSRENQRKFLLENDGWLFIEFSDGNGPKNKSAYLIKFIDWVEKVEPLLKASGMKSIRRLTTYNKDLSIRRYGADVYLGAYYALKWEPTVGWTIPDNHPYWRELLVKLKEAQRAISERSNNDHGDSEN